MCLANSSPYSKSNSSWQALLHRISDREAVPGSITQDVATELFVHQDAGLLLGHACRKGCLKAVVNHSFDGGDLLALGGSQRALPAEHLRLEGGAMVERQNVKRFVEANSHVGISL